MKLRLSLIILSLASATAVYAKEPNRGGSKIGGGSGLAIMHLC